MTLFTTTTEASRDEAKRRAQQLADAIKSAGHLQAFSLSKWTADLRRLQAQVGTRRLCAALTFYCQHATDRTTPRIHSASGFARRFSAIEESAQKHSASSEITPAMFAVTARLTAHLNWPGDTDQQLASALPRTWLFYDEFYRRLQQLAKTLSTNHRLYYFVVFLLHAMPSPAQFCEQWFTRLQQFISSDPERPWDLSAFDLSKNPPAWQWYGAELARRWCCDSRRWQQLQMLCNKEKST